MYGPPNNITMKENQVEISINEYDMLKKTVSSQEAEIDILQEELSNENKIIDKN